MNRPPQSLDEAPAARAEAHREAASDAHAARLLRPLDEVARELAEAHRETDPDTRVIYLSPDPSEQEIRLVEVSDSVGTSGEVLPFRFGPRPDMGIRYPVVVVLLSSEEWRQIEAGQLTLPEAWAQLDAMQVLFRAG